MIKGLICPIHAQGVQPDHFGAGRCIHTTEPDAMAVLNEPDRPLGWTVTELLGSVREAAINKFLDVCVDPNFYHEAHNGTAIHEWMEHWTGIQPRYFGEIDGLAVSGLPDHIRLPPKDEGRPRIIVDWKGKPPYPREARPSNIVQVSMYVHLMSENKEGRPPPTHYQICYKNAPAPVWLPEEPAEVWSIDQCLDHVVAELPETWHGSKVVTVRDNIDMAKSIDAMMAKKVPAIDAIRVSTPGVAGEPTAPCVCAVQMLGRVSKMDRYCAVKHIMCEKEGA